MGTNSGIQALLWDVDGVFVDTEALHFRAWGWLVEKYGGATLSIEEYAPMIGRDSTENMQALCTLKGITADQEQLQRERKEQYRFLRKEGIPLIERNISLVRCFKEEHPEMRFAVVSSAARAYITESLAAAGIAELFEQAISYEDRSDLRRKPAPDMYLYACEIMKVPAVECLAFEDSSNGVKSAHAAGVRVVALPTPLTAMQDVSQASLVVPPGVSLTPEDILSTLG